MAPTCPLTGSKLAQGAKIATESKLKGPEKSIFLGVKITTLRNLRGQECN